MLRLAVILGVVLVCASAAQEVDIPTTCTDNPFFASCSLIVRSKSCYHKYYSDFCCKSCTEARQLDLHLQLNDDVTNRN